MNLKTTILGMMLITFLCSMASATSYNETTPATVRQFLDEIPNSTWGGEGKHISWIGYNRR